MNESIYRRRQNALKNVLGEKFRWNFNFKSNKYKIYVVLLVLLHLV